MFFSFVFDNAICGGITRVGINYIKLLKRDGHNVDAYVLGNKDSATMTELTDICDNVYVKRLSQLMCPDFYWKLAERYTYGKFVFPLAYFCTSVLSFFMKAAHGFRKQYDVVIAFSGHTNDLTYVANNFIRGRKKLCWLHGSQTGYYMISIGYAFLYKKIHNLVVLSNRNDEISKHITERFHISAHKLYNPVFSNNDAVEKNIVADLKEKYGEYFLYVGRLDNDKDPETIIRAYKIMRDKYKIHNDLVFVGDGSKRKALEGMAEEYELTSVIHFEGMRSDVQNYYSGAKIFIHSSPFEGLPTTLIEAMNFGIPIIASDSVPGVNEILENGKCGLVFEVGNEEQLATQCDKMLKDEKLRDKLIALGAERKRDFTPEVIMEGFYSIVNEI